MRITHGASASRTTIGVLEPCVFASRGGTGYELYPSNFLEDSYTQVSTTSIDPVEILSKPMVLGMVPGSGAVAAFVHIRKLRIGIWVSSASYYGYYRMRYGFAYRRGGYLYPLGTEYEGTWFYTNSTTEQKSTSTVSYQAWLNGLQIGDVVLFRIAVDAYVTGPITAYFRLYHDPTAAANTFEAAWMLSSMVR